MCARSMPASCQVDSPSTSSVAASLKHSESVDSYIITIQRGGGEGEEGKERETERGGEGGREGMIDRYIEGGEGGIEEI